MTYQEHFIACWPNEGVGYVKDGEFFPLVNLSTEQHHFEVDPAFLLEEPDMLLHSHCVGRGINYEGDPRSPTFADLEGQIKTSIEWGICVTDGEVCEDPVCWGDPDHRPPLLEREFIHSVQDCLSLCQDWFYQERGIVLPNKPRDPYWASDGQNYMEDLHEQWGFKRLDAFTDLQPGDVLFYRVRTPVVNHLGIYLGNDEVISHWVNEVSCVQPLSRWRSHIEFAARYSPS
jgi:hypothetical protein